MGRRTPRQRFKATILKSGTTTAKSTLVVTRFFGITFGRKSPGVNFARGVVGDNIQVGSNVNNVSIVLARPEYAVEELHPSPTVWAKCEDLPPSQLLDAQRQVVPFHGRKT